MPRAATAAAAGERPFWFSWPKLVGRGSVLGADDATSCCSLERVAVRTTRTFDAIFNLRQISSRTELISRSTPPLGLAIHGRYEPPAGNQGRQCEVAAILVAAGAMVEGEWLESERVRADPQMQAALQRTRHHLI